MIISLLAVSGDSIITPLKTITTSFPCESISVMSIDTFLVGTHDDPRPVHTVTVQGQEGDVQHRSLPNKTYKLGDSKSTFVQHEKTVIITDRFAHKVLMFSLETGWSTSVEDDMIVQPAGVSGWGILGSMFVCSLKTDSIVQLSARGEVVKAHSAGMRQPFAISVSIDGRHMVMSNNIKDKEPTIKLFRVNY